MVQLDRAGEEAERFRGGGPADGTGVLSGPTLVERAHTTVIDRGSRRRHLDSAPVRARVDVTSLE
jgi:hypothetical protein